MRDDHLKRHMSAKHAPLSVSVKPSMMKKCAIRSMKRKAIDVTENACEEKSKTVSSNRHRMIACKVCKRVMHSNNLKRHMGAMHAPLTVDVKSSTLKKCAIRSMKRKRAPKLPALASAFDEKSSSKPEDVKVMFSIACAMKTITDTLHGTFKHIHAEAESIFEMKRIMDASERVTT